MFASPFLKSVDFKCEEETNVNKRELWDFYIWVSSETHVCYF